MSGSKIVAIVFGVLGLLAGAALVAGAGAILTEDRDDAGFYTTDGYAFQRSSSAIVSEDLDILSGAPGWVVDIFADPVDLRISGTTASGQGLFVGIAQTDQVDRYLLGVAHDEVTDVHFDGRSITNVDYDRHDGTATPASPATEAFWETSTVGVGTQTLDWDLDSGNWTVVVMNADGSAGVDADLAFGAKISNITAIAWSVMAFGVLSLLGGAYLVYRGVRRPTDRGRPVDGDGPTNDEVDLRDHSTSDDPPALDASVFDKNLAGQG